MCSINPKGLKDLIGLQSKITTMVKESNPSNSVVEIIEFSHTKISLRKDGIVQLDIARDIVYTVKDIKEIGEAIRKISNGIRLPLLQIPGKYASIDDEARKFVAKDQIKYATASAIINTSLAQSLIANFYIKFNKPMVPTRIFTNKEDAEKWLLTFL